MLYACMYVIRMYVRMYVWHFYLDERPKDLDIWLYFTTTYFTTILLLLYFTSSLLLLYYYLDERPKDLDIGLKRCQNPLLDILKSQRRRQFLQAGCLELVFKTFISHHVSHIRCEVRHMGLLNGS